jgi:hypothetical protein
MTDGLIRTVTVGPFPFFFGNVNVAMGLRGHHHHAEATLVFSTDDAHGYPSFKDTNDAIRARLRDLTGTRNTFRDATNEDVADRLWAALADWRAPEWESWGGRYRLAELHLDVLSVLDDIGHDEGRTRYSIRRPDQEVHQR